MSQDNANGIDVVNTNYGIVRLSQKTLYWLDHTYPDWRVIVFNKRKRGKRADLVRKVVCDLENAVQLCSEIMFFNGETLTEF